MKKKINYLEEAGKYEERQVLQEDAAGDYAKKSKELDKAMKQLHDKLEKHAEDFKKSGSKDYGYVGDLGHYTEVLKDLVNPK